MKKVNSFRPMVGRWLFALLFVLGFMFTGTVEINAQSTETIQVRKAHFTTIQTNYAPGSAKWDLVQGAINYLNWIENNTAANPNFLDGQAPIAQSDQIRKAHPTILKNYTAAQINGFQAEYNQLVDGGTNTSDAQLVKLQWILEANAY